jgi:hypothetical protein
MSGLEQVKKAKVAQGVGWTAYQLSLLCRKELITIYR